MADWSVVQDGLRRLFLRRAGGRRIAAAVLGGLVGIALAIAITAVLVSKGGRDRSIADRSAVDSAIPLQPLAFSALTGWADDRHDAAFAAFLRSCERQMRRAPETRAAAAPADAFIAVCRKALATAPVTARAARRFFEDHFCPHLVAAPETGLLTSYFEPELDGRLRPGDGYTVPLYRRPDDLVRVTGENRPENFPSDFGWARQAPDGSLLPYHTRAEIAAGALADRGLELVWLNDPAEAFFVHIQGSTRIRLADGSVIRLGYAAKNGHPYTSVGREMLREGALKPHSASAEAMKDWFRANPEAGAAYMARNASYVFFRILEGLNPELGPVGGEGVQLTSGRSLAVDRALYSYGLPFWIDAELPTGQDGEKQPFQRLMIAQDTGAAITGPARGDLFWGSGSEAGVIAGRIKEPGRFVVFLPCPQ